jgi:hypothetical protein
MESIKNIKVLTLKRGERKTVNSRESKTTTQALRKTRFVIQAKTKTFVTG